MEEKTASQIRFENARKKLSQAFLNLDEVIKDKIHEAAENSKMLNFAGGDLQNANAKLAEQKAIIASLNDEINQLQKNLSDLGLEVESLNADKKDLMKEFAQSRKDAANIIQSIENQISKIEEALNEET